MEHIGIDVNEVESQICVLTESEGVAPNYGTSCEGIEREWWSELEWEDALERMGS